MELPAARRSMLTESQEDRLVASLVAQLPSASSRADEVHAGPGQDDCAIVRPPKRKDWQLLKTDCVIEGVHFAHDALPEQVGWKALCRPLSDIAASGGKPTYALVTLGLNRKTPPDWARAVYAGIARAATAYEVCVVGGDTASTPGPSFLSVFLAGTAKRGRCVTRAGGRPGDTLYVTGALGGSLGSGRHLTFCPRLREAQWLTANFHVRAMMDLSDGLAADLPRLARASGTGFTLSRDRVPVSPGCNLAQALGDGEDYELLFALGRRQSVKLELMWSEFSPALPLTNIGELAMPDTFAGLERAGGFDHFAAERSALEF